MWVGAAYLSVTLLQMEIEVLPEFITEFRTYHRIGGFGPILVPLSVASVLLIFWCDFALLIDAVKTRHSCIPPEKLPWPRRTGWC